MDFKGSKTEKNLYKTFAGESRARNKYTLYAEKAKEEGYRWVGDVFEVTAHNELAHAREVFEWLKLLGTTKENLIAATMGETEEFKNMYKIFEDEAREEGFVEIADFYKELREAEEAHDKRFRNIIDKLEKGELFKDPNGDKWICTNCGYIYGGQEVPKNCPLCKYPRAYYKPYCEKTNE